MAETPRTPRNRGSALYERDVNARKEREERLEAERRRREAEELREVTGAPRINGGAANARQARSFMEYNRQWMLKKKEAIERQKALQESVRAHETTLKPVINARSVKILSKKNYKNVVEKWDEQFERFVRKREQEGEEYSFTPKIDERAATLYHSEPAHERLYRLSRQQVAAREHEEEPHSPPSPLSSATPSRNVHAELYEEASRRQQRQERKREEEVLTNSFTPTVDARSRELASKVARKPLYMHPSLLEETSERGSPGEKQSVVSESTARSDDRAFDSFLRRHEEKMKEIEAKRERLRTEAERQTTAECSFTPSIDQNSALLSAQSRSKSLYERSSDLLEQRREELAAAQRTREEQEMAECTFAPHLVTRAEASVVGAQARTHSGAALASPRHAAADSSSDADLSSLERYLRQQFASVQSSASGAAVQTPRHSALSASLPKSGYAERAGGRLEQLQKQQVQSILRTTLQAQTRDAEDPSPSPPRSSAQALVSEWEREASLL